MKKIIAIMFAVAIVVASCSKEKKLNRKLNGEWELVSVDGVPAATAGYTMTIKFDKDKKAGSYTTTSTFGGVTETDMGTYELVDDTQIIMQETGSTDKDTSYVKEYSKTDMTITDKDGTFPIVLKKK